MLIICEIGLKLSRTWLIWIWLDNKKIKNQNKAHQKFQYILPFTEKVKVNLSDLIIVTKVSSNWSRAIIRARAMRSKINESKKSLVFGAPVKITLFQNNAGQQVIIKHFTENSDHCILLLLSSAFKCPFACFKCQKKIDSFCSECHEFHWMA